MAVHPPGGWDNLGNATGWRDKLKGPKPMKDNRPLLTLLAITLAGFLVCSGFVAGCSFQGCEYKPEPPVVVVPEVVQPDQVVYVYEQRSGSVPSAIAAGLDKLNRAGIDASPFEDDSTDGGGDVPEQYAAALDAARLAGLPALVVLGKGDVLTIANGGTEAETIEQILRDHK
jgi:hypothetical protein